MKLVIFVWWWGNFFRPRGPKLEAGLGFGPDAGSGVSAGAGHVDLAGEDLRILKASQARRYLILARPADDVLWQHQTVVVIGWLAVHRLLCHLPQRGGDTTSSALPPLRQRPSRKPVPHHGAAWLQRRAAVQLVTLHTECTWSRPGTPDSVVPARAFGRTGIWRLPYNATGPENRDLGIGTSTSKHSFSWLLDLTRGLHRDFSGGLKRPGARSA